MHDLLEGALPLEVKEMIKALIASRVITLAELQTAMECFPYSGVDSRNKPVPIASKTLSAKDHALNQTGKC